MTKLRKHFLRENGVYHAAKARCNNPNVSNYARYGGRGIQFKFKSFEEFIDHIGPRPDGFQLDRIDTNGNYEPGNVRWISPEGNANNVRTNVHLTHDGRTQTVSQWAKEYGVDPEAFRSRIKRGWSWERATSSSS